MYCPVRRRCEGYLHVHQPYIRIMNLHNRQYTWHSAFHALFYVDKKNQLDVKFFILYFSSNSCSTCFGQPCVHHEELTTA